MKGQGTEIIAARHKRKAAPRGQSPAVQWVEVADAVYSKDDSLAVDDKLLLPVL